jgi:hypothetical protein
VTSSTPSKLSAILRKSAAVIARLYLREYLTSLDGALASARELGPRPSQETSGKEAAVGGWTFILSTSPVGSGASRNLDRRAFTRSLKFLFADDPLGEPFVHSTRLGEWLASSATRAQPGADSDTPCREFFQQNRHCRRYFGVSRYNRSPFQVLSELSGDDLPSIDVRGCGSNLNERPASNECEGSFTFW